MTINQQPKVAMDSADSLPDPGALQGARRATGDAPGSAPQSRPTGADMEVVARARRRVFTSADKRRILAAAERCTMPGEIGALLRRQGVVSYQVVQEFCNVACKNQRLSLPPERILAYVKLVLQPMNQVAPSPELLEAALGIRSESGFSFYDSLVIAAARAAQCQVLYSEDLQHGQLVGDVSIVNPFLQGVNEAPV